MMPAAVQRAAPWQDCASASHCDRHDAPSPAFFDPLVQASEPPSGAAASGVDGQHLIEPFEDAGADARCLLIEPAGEIAQTPQALSASSSSQPWRSGTADRKRSGIVAIYGAVKDFRPFVEAFRAFHGRSVGPQGCATKRGAGWVRLERFTEFPAPPAVLRTMAE
jgi:hypothetical protein